MARILAFATVFFTFALPMFTNLSLAQTLLDRCGDPPPVANESLKGEIKGQVSALSRLLGQGTLEGQIELAQKEIFSKYPEAETSRSNASFEYYFCLIIMDDEKLSTQQKIDELIRVRGAIQKEQLRGSLGTSTINKYFIATLVSAAYSPRNGTLSISAILQSRFSDIYGLSYLRKSAVAVDDIGNAFGAKAVAGFVAAFGCSSSQLSSYTVITPLSQQSIVFVFGTEPRQKDSNQAFGKRGSVTPEIGESFAFSAVLCLLTEDGRSSLPIGITNIPLGS